MGTRKQDRYGKTYRIAIAEVGKPPRLVEVDGSLESLQELVGGRIEPVDILWGDQPCLYVNEEGMVNGMEANRGFVATKAMAEACYLSQIDHSRLVEPGEPYCVLFGNLLGVSYDYDPDEGPVIRDITDEEWERFRNEFEDPQSGWVMLLIMISASPVENRFAEPSFSRNS